MREYSGENLFLGFIENYQSKFIGRIARIHNDRYFSVFLQINKDSYFDLSTNCLYVSKESKQIKMIKSLNPEKKFTEKRLEKILKEQLKTL